MKPLEYNRHNFLYKVREFGGGFEGSTQKETEFYDAEPTIKFKYRKKYLLFGPKIKVVDKKYKKLFTLNFNIESPNYSKKEVQDALWDEIVLLKRKREIKNGKVV